jgi:hypothetical protein
MLIQPKDYGINGFLLKVPSNYSVSFWLFSLSTTLLLSFSGFLLKYSAKPERLLRNRTEKRLKRL